VGQRKGLRIGRPAADGKPRFVLDISPVSGTVTVGAREQLAVDWLTGTHVRWCGSRPTEPGWFDCAAQVRAHGAAAPASARLVDGGLQVRLIEPMTAVAAGQAVVLYDGDRVIGSATIDSTDRHAAHAVTGVR
jgi:tRNA-specific 2-thiouridylase